MTKYYVDGDTIKSYYSSVDNQGWETSSNEYKMSDKNILETFTDEFLSTYDRYNGDDIRRIVTVLRRDKLINDIL